MLHHLSSSPALRRDWNALVCPLPDPTSCSRRLVQNAVPFPHGSLKSPGLSSFSLQRGHGLLSFRSIGSIQSRPRSVTNAIACDNSAGGDAPKQKFPTEKVTRIALLGAIAVAAAVFARAGSAFANSQLLMPNLARSPAVAKSGRELLVSAWMGLMAGCLHTLTGPDHLAALAPLSIGRTKLQSVAVGALWGCGHDAGQLIFGLIFLLLKDKLQIEVIQTWGARVVGMTLVAIGMVGMKEAHEAAMVPCIAGGGGSFSSTHNMGAHSLPASSGKRNISLTTFATGVVHGLQPDALIMILPALALPSRFAGAAFLIMFLLGTVLSMSGYTAFIGSCSSALQKRIPRITEHLAWGSSLLAILVGVGILGSEIFGLSIF